jgi:alpha-mannosidase
VGGTWIQPDTNLLASEMLCRHYHLGLRCFREVPGVRVKTAWQADSFGHTSELPEVLAAAGIENFAFSRPPQESFPLRLPAFWWRGLSSVRILAYRVPLGWYGTERDEVTRRFAQLPALAAESPLRNIGVFVGLGNHGGGPSQRQIDEVRAWAAAHPEFEVRFSGLHAFFAADQRG